MWTDAAIALARELYPWLTTAAASDAFLASWADHVERLAGDGWFGDSVVIARAHLLAHVAIIADPAGLLAEYSSGPIQSITSGRRSRSYATQAATGSVTLTDADLGRTPPGRAYRMLRDSRPGRVARVIL